jgi:hypothetical protein
VICPRWFARLCAYVLGYFWMPCPVCGENFAGFECDPGWGAVLVQKADGPHMLIVCSKPACAAEGQRQVRAQQQEAMQRFLARPPS